MSRHIKCIKQVLGLLILAASVLTAIRFPVGNIVLPIGVILFFFSQVRYKTTWLFFLPAFLPIVNLAPWSGIVLYEEFDFFIIATIAAGIWNGVYFKKASFQFSGFHKVIITLIGFSLIISLWIGLTPLHKLTLNDYSNYLSSYNSLRIGRSFIWALLMLPLLKDAFQSDIKSARKALVWGICCGLIGVGLTVFWERGVIYDLLNAANRYEAMRSLLDFSSEYRITGLFSELHTGGSAIDGYIALTWVFSIGYYLSLLFRFDNSRILFSTIAGLCLSLFALAFSCYTLATTFTRITYLAAGISVLVLILGLAIHRSHPLKYYYKVLPAAAACICLFFYLLTRSYGIGGFLALISVLFVLSGSFAIGVGSIRVNPGIWLSGLFIVLCLGVYGIARAAITSKYIVTPVIEIFSVATVTTIAILFGGAAIAKYAAYKKFFWKFLGVTLPFVFLLSASIPMVFGNRMETRFSQSAEDAENRLSHWKDVLSAMDHGMVPALIGMGLGSFPRYFLAKNDHAKGIGSFAYKEEIGNGFLRLFGGSDLEIGQRFFLKSAVQSHGCKLSFRARTNFKNRTIGLRFCQRNLLHAAGCDYFKIRLSAHVGQWQEYNLEIPANAIPDIEWYSQWPNVFLIRSQSKGDAVDIDNIRVIDSNGKNIVDNGGFEKGGQRWFSYNEFEHLPWHTKNMWLHLFFEQGLLGVFSFVLMSGFALVNAWKYFRNGDLFGLILISSIIGFLVVGITGSLIDAPRVTFLFLLVAFTAMLVGAEDKPERAGNSSLLAADRAAWGVEHGASGKEHGAW